MTTTKHFGEQFRQAGGDFIERFLKAGTGFPVNFSDGVFQCFQRLDQIVMLSIQIIFTLRLRFEFVDCRQVDGTQTGDADTNALQLLSPVRFVGLLR